MPPQADSLFCLMVAMLLLIGRISVGVTSRASVKAAGS